MKPKNKLRAFLLGSTIIASAPSLYATTYYFDTNGTASGFGNTDKSITDANVWNVNADGTTAVITPALAQGDTLNFGTSVDGYTGTVSVGMKITRVNIGSASGNIIFGGTWEPTSASGLIFNDSNANTTFTGAINGNTANITQSGGGKLIITGAKIFGSHASAGGIVTINSGIYSTNSLANAGTDSGLGRGTTGNLATRLVFNGGALEYTGGTTSTDRNFQIQSGGATIQANGSSGALTWSGTATLDSAANRTLTLDGTNTNNNTFSGTLADNGAGKLSLTKSGAGTWILTGTKTYTGATNINAGALIINGSTSSTSLVSVDASATLGGGGTVGGATTINGTLSPGDGVTPGATLTLGSTLALNSGSILAFGLGTSSDLIDFTTLANNLSGSGLATLQISQLAGFSYASTYTIFQDTTTTGFTLANITGYDSVGYTANFGEVGDNYVLSFTAVPEPSAALLGGLSLLAFLRRKR